MAQLRNINVIVRVNKEVPAQVLLSKPVVLLDARGRYAPFHLEVIDSAEAFIAVLKVRFKDVGLRKIESGEFALEDSRLKRGLQLTKPWAVIVSPGQHISMSMVFRLEENRTARCPGCGKENAGSDLEDVECENTFCGITYCRIVEEYAAIGTQSNHCREAESGDTQSSDSDPQLKAPDPLEESINDEMQHYTRLHILTQATITYSRPPHDDELYIMKAFARHASHCSDCAHPYEVHRKGGSLCSKGHLRALDVAQYVFNKAGQTFSLVDFEGNRRVQIEIPADCAVILELLKAVERGLRLRRKRPAAVASRGDAVLIGFMGGLNHPDLVTKAGEEPLPQLDDSDVDDPMEVEGREKNR
ncbi:MAG: hypothetical protein ALECFALPRED_008993 [Alectoria fallacina]|uniref:Ubiquitin-like domain-containing protein n=1 Tax=Alectoria fallacina TaxID=1903189 RepID=A0A8H3J5L1_9LECA|nr:MAG: hypothetical protein ALECFALPRED_008993 [Alectoria fallacina]